MKKVPLGQLDTEVPPLDSLLLYHPPIGAGVLFLGWIFYWFSLLYTDPNTGVLAYAWL